MKRLVVSGLWLVVSSVAAFAWDVEHDEVAMLVGEHLPAEMKSFFTFDDFDTLISYCHFPDMTEWEPRHFHTLDELEEVVGKRDRDVIEAHGFRGNWMHCEAGKAALMAMLSRAFARGESHNAAFYLSALTHPVGDESALNHPPLLNFYQYCHFEGVDFGAKKVEAGAKNIFGFRSDGNVMRLARMKLKGYRPRLPPVEGFSAQVLWHCEQAVGQSDYAAQKEAEIGFAKCKCPEDALADLVAMQARALVDIAWTCWVNRSENAPLPDDDFKKRFNRRVAELESECDPSKQAVFGDLFDATKNPVNPKGTVGIVCEAIGFRGTGVQSYMGRIISGACGRTLRDRGWAVKGISLRALREGAIKVSETPIVIAALGDDAPSEDQAAALIAFRKAGGRLVYISGQNPKVLRERITNGSPLAIGNGDPKDISGFAGQLVDHKCEEVPVSPGWNREGACADWRKMAVEYGGRRYPLRRDANGDGWSKVACIQEVKLADGIEPIAWLDNGNERFCVGARRGKVTWLPGYMLSPLLFCEETKIDLGSLRLDSFAEKVLMEELK